MAKKKTKKRAKPALTAKKKTAKKPVKRAKAKAARAKKPLKKAVKKAVKKAGAKKVAKKARAKKPAARKPLARPVSRRPAQAAAKPKLPRRTKQAAPPETRVMPAPVVDVTPLAPPPPPPPPPVSAPPVGPGPTPAPAAPPEAESTEAPPADEFPPAPEVGDLAPDFALPDENGLLHSLAQYRGQRVVLYFYPKDDTPGCTTEACGFRDALGTFTDRGTVVLGLSPDSVESHRRFVDKYGLNFPLLADTDHAVAERYGVWVEKSRAGTTYMGIARTTFIIDAEGHITRVFANVKPEGHAPEVLAKLGA